MTAPSVPNRLISLDVFRGMTIAGMVLVNNPGTWSAIYGPLKHAEWHGITPTDYVFPFFLFIVGVAIPIALSKRLKDGIRRDVYAKIFRRAALIFGLGVAMSVIPFFDFAKTEVPLFAKLAVMLALTAALFFLLLRNLAVGLALIGVSAVVMAGFYLAGYEIVPFGFETMRIPGVLQRIAVCYLIVALIYLHTDWKQQTMIAVGLLLLYWLLMTLVPVPGCDIATVNDKACNLAAYLDRLVLTENHMWRSSRVFDPEGILSTIPAIVTTLSGVLAGTWMIKSEPPASAGGFPAAGEASNRETSTDYPSMGGNVNIQDAKSKIANGLFFFGTLLVTLGWSWSLVFPLNKSLWTSSYVLYTSGLALLTLAACYWLIDIKGYTRWTKPFVIFGINALALFVFSGIMARILGMIRMAGAEPGQTVSLQQWIFQTVFLPFAAPINASLAYAICFILFWLVLMWLLYRKRIYIKV